MSRIEKPKSRAAVRSGAYRPARQLNKRKNAYRYAFSLDPATIEYKANMLSLVSGHDLACAASEIVRTSDNRLTGKRRKRKRNGPRLSVAVFAGLSLDDIEI